MERNTLDGAEANEACDSSNALPAQALSAHALSTGALRLAIAGALGSALLAGAERLLFEARDLAELTALTSWLTLPFFLACQWLPYVVGGTALLNSLKRLLLASDARAKKQKWLLRAALLTPLLLIAAAYSRYTFGGREASLLWYRPLGLLIATVTYLAALALPFIAITYLGRRSHLAGASCLLAAGALAALTLNRLVLPDEYEPLHILLSVIAVLYVSCFGALAARGVSPTRKAWFGPVTLAGTLALAITCTLLFSENYRLSFLVYGKSAATRYIGFRWQLNSSSGATRKQPVRLKPALLNKRLLAAARQTRAAKAAPHIIVVSIDNIQANHVGAYGYTKHPTTPNIDALAAKGMLFERAYSCFPRTRIFSSSLLLGRLVPPFKDHDPPAHYRKTALTLLLKQRNYHVLLKGWFDTQDRFKPNGYGVDTWMPPASEDPRRRSRGFRHVPMARNFKVIRKHFEASRSLGKPVFAWMHFLRPHHHGSRFLPDNKYDFGETTSDHYDSAIAAADAYLPELQKLAEAKLDPGRPVYWVIVSDHGAGFATRKGESVFNEGRNVGEEFVHVPLIVAGPAIVAGRSPVLVSAAIDLSATLLDLTGIEPPTEYDGVSLMPVLSGKYAESAAASRALYLRYYGWSGALYDSYKLIAYSGGLSLYNLAEDPHEQVNIADQHPKLVRQLHSLLKREKKRIQSNYVASPVGP